VRQAQRQIRQAQAAQERRYRKPQRLHDGRLYADQRSDSVAGSRNADGAPDIRSSLLREKRLLRQRLPRPHVNGVLLFARPVGSSTLFGSYSNRRGRLPRKHVRARARLPRADLGVASDFLQRGVDVIFATASSCANTAMQRVASDGCVRSHDSFPHVPLPVLRARLEREKCHLPAFNFSNRSRDARWGSSAVPKCLRRDEKPELVVVRTGSVSTVNSGGICRTTSVPRKR